MQRGASVMVNDVKKMLRDVGHIAPEQHTAETKEEIKETDVQDASIEAKEKLRKSGEEIFSENTPIQNFVINVINVISEEKYNKYNKYNNITNITINYNDIFNKENQTNKIKWALFVLSNTKDDFEGLDYKEMAKVGGVVNIQGMGTIVGRMKTSGDIEKYNKPYNKKNIEVKKCYILTENAANDIKELIETLFMERIDEVKKNLAMNEYKQKIQESVLNLKEELGSNDEIWSIENDSIILDDPVKTLEELEQNLNSGSLDIFIDKTIRIKNLPKSSNKEVRKVNTKDLDKLYSFDVEVVTSTEILPCTTRVKFECPSCGTLISVLQPATRGEEKGPSHCSCGRRGGFKELGRDTVDYRILLCSDNPESFEDSAPTRSKRFHLLGDIANIGELLIQPSSKLKITGTPSLKQLKTGEEIDIDVNYVESNDELLVLDFSGEERTEFKKFSKTNPVKIIKEEVFDLSVSGYDPVKMGLIIQQVGGTPKKLNNGAYKRGDVHVLLVGDPASSKSILAATAQKLSTRYSKADANRGTSAGLTGTFEYNQQLGRKVRMSGMLDEAKGGLLIWEEFNEAHEDVQATLKTPLESSEYSVSLATGRITSKCPFAFLATLNPKSGNYLDPTKSTLQQIPLNPALKTRIDLIWGGFIKSKNTKEIETILEKQDLNEDIDKERFNFFKKYLAFCKMQKATIPAEVKTLINGFCLGLIKNTDANFRIKDTMNRLVEAFAKIELRNEARAKDFERAKELFLASLRSTSAIKPDGTQDLDLSQFVETSTDELQDIEKIKVAFDKLLLKKDTCTKKELYIESGLGSARFSYILHLILNKRLIDKSKIDFGGKNE